ncbi:unnamed protein product [Rotaria socialis]
MINGLQNRVYYHLSYQEFKYDNTFPSTTLTQNRHATKSKETSTIPVLPTFERSNCVYLPAAKKHNRTLIISSTNRQQQEFWYTLELNIIARILILN